MLSWLTFRVLAITNIAAINTVSAWFRMKGTEYRTKSSLNHKDLLFYITRDLELSGPSVGYVSGPTMPLRQQVPSYFSCHAQSVAFWPPGLGIRGAATGPDSLASSTLFKEKLISPYTSHFLQEKAYVPALIAINTSLARTCPSMNMPIHKQLLAVTSLVVQCLRLCTPNAGAWVRSWSRELRSHGMQTVKENYKGVLRTCSMPTN